MTVCERSVGDLRYRAYPVFTCSMCCYSVCSTCFTEHYAPKHNTDVSHAIRGYVKCRFCESGRFEFDEVPVYPWVCGTVDGEQWRQQCSKASLPYHMNATTQYHRIRDLRKQRKRAGREPGSLEVNVMKATYEQCSERKRQHNERGWCAIEGHALRFTVKNKGLACNMVWCGVDTTPKQHPLPSSSSNGSGTNNKSKGTIMETLTPLSRFTCPPSLDNVPDTTFTMHCPLGATDVLGFDKLKLFRVGDLGHDISDDEEADGFEIMGEAQLKEEMDAVTRDIRQQEERNGGDDEDDALAAKRKKREHKIPTDAQLAALSSVRFGKVIAGKPLAPQPGTSGGGGGGGGGGPSVTTPTNATTNPNSTTRRRRRGATTTTTTMTTSHMKQQAEELAIVQIIHCMMHQRVEDMAKDQRVELERLRAVKKLSRGELIGHVAEELKKAKAEKKKKADAENDNDHQHEEDQQGNSNQSTVRKHEWSVINESTSFAVSSLMEGRNVVAAGFGSKIPFLNCIAHSVEFLDCPIYTLDGFLPKATHEPALTAIEKSLTANVKQHHKVVMARLIRRKLQAKREGEEVGPHGNSALRSLAAAAGSVSMTPARPPGGALMMPSLLDAQTLNPHPNLRNMTSPGILAAPRQGNNVMPELYVTGRFSQEFMKKVAIVNGHTKPDEVEGESAPRTLLKGSIKMIYPTGKDVDVDCRKTGKAPANVDLPLLEVGDDLHRLEDDGSINTTVTINPQLIPHLIGAGRKRKAFVETQAAALKKVLPLKQILLIHNIDLLEGAALAKLSRVYEQHAQNVLLLASVDDPSWFRNPANAAFVDLARFALVFYEGPIYPKVTETKHLDSAGWERSARAKTGAPPMADTVRRILLSVPTAFRSILRLILELQQEHGDDALLNLNLIIDYLAEHRKVITTSRMRSVVNELVSNRLGVYEAASHSMRVLQPTLIAKALDELESAD